jgi:hypothetical protein
MALKELTEMLAGQRGGREDHAVTWGEMPTTTTYKGDGAWNPLPFINGWTNYPAPYSPCGFRKLSSGLVLLRGLTMSGTAAGICNLPAGYRPGIQMLYVAETSPNVDCRIDITTTGVVSHTGGNNGWLSLSNICFLAEF